MLKKATSKFAHNPAVISLTGTNQDLKLLQNLISAEKTILLTLQKLSANYAKASEALRAWGLSEGDDLGGILTASTLLLNHFSSALLKYASHGDTMRRQLKAIRTRVENLDNLKRQRRTIQQKIEDLEHQLEGMGPEHKNFSSRTEALNSLLEAVRDMNSSIKSEEAALDDFKRTSTKIWMGLKFGGLVECCEKGAIAGRFGNLIIAEISEEMTQPGLPRNLNYRRNEVETCVADAHRGVNAVTLSTVPIVGFRDRDQYIQRSSITPPSDTPPAFYLSTQIGYVEPSNDGPSRLSGEPQHPPTFPEPQVDYGEPSNNGPSSFLSEPQLPATFPEPRVDYGEQSSIGPSSLLDEPQIPPQPQCSCAPSSLGNHRPQESWTSLAYLQTAQNTAESSLPQTLPPYQPEVSDATVDNNVVNVPSTAVTTDPVASPNIASSDTARGQLEVAAPSVSTNVPATVTAPAVASSDTASSSTPRGQMIYKRPPGTFGGTTPDPFSIRARPPASFGIYVEEESVFEVPLESPKPGFFSKFFGAFKKK